MICCDCAWFIPDNEFDGDVIGRCARPGVPVDKDFDADLDGCLSFRDGGVYITAENNMDESTRKMTGEYKVLVFIGECECGRVLGLFDSKKDARAFIQRWKREWSAAYEEDYDEAYRSGDVEEIWWELVLYNPSGELEF